MSHQVQGKHSKARHMTGSSSSTSFLQPLTRWQYQRCFGWPHLGARVWLFDDEVDNHNADVARSLLEEKAEWFVLFEPPRSPPSRSRRCRRCRATLGGRARGRGRPARCGEMRGDAARCGEMWGDAGRCGEMRGDVARCGEMWGDTGRARGRGRPSGCAPTRAWRWAAAVSTPG